MSHRKDERMIKSFRKKPGQKSKIPMGQPFIWFTREMMESEAFKALSGNAFKVLSRLLIEQMSHAGTENGNLICTHTDLADYGIRRASIGQAVRQLSFMGFVRVEKGFAYRGEHTPNKYRLTWLVSSNGEAATNEWKTINIAHVEAYQIRLKCDQELKREATQRRRSIRAENKKRLVQKINNVFSIDDAKRGNHV